MKKLLYIALLGTLSLVSCKSDDEFYNQVYLSVPDLITIDTPPALTGEALSFHTEFSRYLPEEGQTNLLDIRKTSGADYFGFAYRLEKKNTSNQWVTVFNNENEYEPVNANYNSTSMTYKADKDVTITAAGDYRLSFGQSYTGVQSTDLISANAANKTMVRITTNADNTNSQGFLYFTVN